MEVQLATLNKQILESQTILAVNLLKAKQLKLQAEVPIHQSFQSKQESRLSQKQVRTLNARLKRVTNDQVNGKREQQRLVDHLRELVHVNNQEENRITVTIAESKNVNAEIAQVDAEIVKVREDIMKNNRRDTELEAQWSSVDLAVERVISNSTKMSNM